MDDNQINWEGLSTVSLTQSMGFIRIGNSDTVKRINSNTAVRYP